MDLLYDRVEKTGAKIDTILMLNGSSFSAKVFVDCTYEGDLMAKAGVSYTLGREGAVIYNESLAGVQYTKREVPLKIAPYDERGNLLPGVMPGPPPKHGRSSHHPVGYNIRMNVCQEPDSSNFIEIKKDL